MHGLPHPQIDTLDLSSHTAFGEQSEGVVWRMPETDGQTSTGEQDKCSHARRSAQLCLKLLVKSTQLLYELY